MSARGLPSIIDIIKHPDEHIQGYPLHTWYRGIIEDVIDPEKRGRVRVRVESVFRSVPGVPAGGSTPATKPTSLAKLGPGEDKGDGVETKFLPWADIVIQGQGNKYGTFNTPEIGDAVVVVFEFGRAEYPLIIGSWWGFNRESPSVTEVPIAALGGTEGATDTGGALKGQDTIPGVTGVTLTEPANPYGAVYPQNKVYRGKSGHLVEFDNTTGAERINVTHMSGTWVEFHPDGGLVIGVQGKRYTLVVEDDDEHVKGNKNVVVDLNATRKVTGDVTEEVTGEQVISSTGKTTVKSIADMTIQSVGGKLFLKALNNITTEATSYTIQGFAGAPAVAYDIKGLAVNVSATGATGFPVVTTGTHPIDYITGLPIIGLPNFTAGP